MAIGQDGRPGGRRVGQVAGVGPWAWAAHAYGSGGPGEVEQVGTDFTCLLDCLSLWRTTAKPASLLFSLLSLGT